MKIAASNIAWDTADMDRHLGILSLHGASGLEISPSMIWEEPTDVPYTQVTEFKKKVFSYALNIPSMHSLTYNRPELRLFDSVENRERMIEYIIKLGRLSSELECPAMVFGSGRSRNIENSSRSECMKITTDSFFYIAEKIMPLGVVLLIEYLSPQYTDFINSANEAAQLVKNVNHPNFMLHIDIRTSMEIHENPHTIWNKYKGLIRGVHTGNPGLLPPSEDYQEHFQHGYAMRKTNYNGYVSIEMVRRIGRTETDLTNALKFVKRAYLNED